MTPLSRRQFLRNAVAALPATALLCAVVHASPAPARHLIEISRLTFGPVRLAVRPGDTVIWMNRDIVAHTATADDGSWDSGTIGAGEAWTMVLAPGFGTTYFCRFHPAMRARLDLD